MRTVEIEPLFLGSGEELLARILFHRNAPAYAVCGLKTITRKNLEGVTQVAAVGAFGQETVLYFGVTFLLLNGLLIAHHQLMAAFLPHVLEIESAKRVVRHHNERHDGTDNLRCKSFDSLQFENVQQFPMRLAMRQQTGYRNIIENNEALQIV